MTGRKIIQILDARETADQEGYLTALCNDGTIWVYSRGEWDLLTTKEIPQFDINYEGVG